MAVINDYLFPAMWLGYTAYWWAMSTDVKETKRREPGLPRFARMVLVLCALAQLRLPRVPVAALNNRFLPPGTWWFWCGAAVTAGGMFSLYGHVAISEKTGARRSP